MAQTFRQRIAQAEAMARADMLRFQPEVFFFISHSLVYIYWGRERKRERPFHVEAHFV